MTKKYLFLTFIFFAANVTFVSKSYSEGSVLESQEKNYNLLQDKYDKLLKEKESIAQDRKNIIIQMKKILSEKREMDELKKSLKELKKENSVLTKKIAAQTDKAALEKNSKDKTKEMTILEGKQPFSEEKKVEFSLEPKNIETALKEEKNKLKKAIQRIESQLEDKNEIKGRLISTQRNKHKGLLQLNNVEKLLEKERNNLIRSLDKFKKLDEQIKKTKENKK